MHLFTQTHTTYSEHANAELQSSLTDVVEAYEQLLVSLQNVSHDTTPALLWAVNNRVQEHRHLCISLLTLADNSEDDWIPAITKALQVLWERGWHGLSAKGVSLSFYALESTLLAHSQLRYEMGTGEEEWLQSCEVRRLLKSSFLTLDKARYLAAKYVTPCYTKVPSCSFKGPITPPFPLLEDGEGARPLYRVCTSQWLDPIVRSNSTERI